MIFVTPLWGFEVHQGSVLYLALEDDYQRMAEILFIKADEVSDVLGISRAEAYRIIKN